MLSLTDADFDSEIRASSLPVIVDVWGEHCGPCMAMEPVLKQIEAEHRNEVKVCKLKLFDAPETGMRYNIRALPTFLFFKDGELKGRHSGAISKDGLLQKLDAC